VVQFHHGIGDSPRRSALDFGRRERSFSEVRIGRRTPDGAGQVRTRCDAQESSMARKVAFNVAEVFEMGSGDYGLAEQRGFENIVPAPRSQSSTHEDNLGMREQAAEFADGIEQQYIG
jgi:hypothetical protein